MIEKSLGKLPDFIIVGAQKCATGFLVRHLGKHPLIEFATDDDHKSGHKTREMQFFTIDSKFALGVNWYKRKFSGEFSGEKTPGIMSSKKAIRRMHETVPEARLVAALRNPVDRLYSNYMMARQGRFVSPERTTAKPFEEWFEIGMQFIKDKNWPESVEDRVAASATWKGLYYEHISVIFDSYPPDRLHVVITERLRADANSEINHIFHFFGLQPYHLNEEDIAWSESNYEPMNPATRRQLLDFYNKHNESLFDMLGFRVDEWNR